MSDDVIRSQQDWSLIVDALVSYADACVLPLLTPSCPFYEVTPEGPQCEEQCRALSERAGGPPRPVQQMVVGGLVMQGRLLPLSTAGGYEPYDAMQRFVTERTLEPRAQSTASLLLGLRAALLIPILGDAGSRAEQAMKLWSELARRRIRVEKIVRGALLSAMSQAVVERAVAPLLVEAGAVPIDLSSEVRTAIVESAGTGWPAVLRSATASWDSREEMSDSIASAKLRASMPPPRDNSVAWPVLYEPQTEPVELPDQSETLDLPELELAYSHLFFSLIQEWLSRLLEDDLASVLCAAPPPASVLLALPTPTDNRDEVGLWIWERLTRTHLDEWSTSSLLIEWKRAHGEDPEIECPPLVLAERQVDLGQVSNLALERLSRHRGHHGEAEGLSAGTLTDSAVQHLRQGRWQVAADIFAGLIALRPGDGDAWNNLGFCQLPGDSESALRSLQRASLYPRKYPLVNIANRSLALHLIGRDSDSLRILNQVLDSPQQETLNGEARPSTSFFLWRHRTREQPLELIEQIDLQTYVTELRTHVMMENCDHPAWSEDENSTDLPPPVQHEEPTT